MGQPKERKIRTLSSKITVMILLMIVVSTAAVGAFSYFFYRNSVIDNYSRQALQLATAFAELIDADEFQNTMATLETGEYDADLQAHVDRIKADLGMAFLYAGTFDENVGLYSYIEALLPNEAHNYGLGDVVPIEAFPPAAINANRGAPGSTDIIYDPVQGVRLIAAYAPIYDSSRNIVGIAGACFNVTEPLANVNEFALIMLAIIVLAVCVLIWFPVIFIRKSVAHPLTLLRRIAVGDTSVNINTNSNDEVGLLAGDFIRIQSMFGRLINDLKNLAEKHERYGETDARLNASDYSGAYADVAVSINKMLDNKDAIDNETFKCIMNIVDGHFDTPLRKFPGKVAFINETVDGLRENMRGVKEDIAAIVESVAEGNLAYTADISRYKGDWAELMKGLNNILTGIHEALDENVKVIHVMAGGDFTKKAEGNFKGDFLAVSNALNTTVDTISSYIEEITSELSYIANGDLRHGIKREYIGQFVSIKDSINTIVIEISKMMGNISNASGEVLSGAVQISENSANLSQGVSEQLGSLQELTASVSGIEAQSKENAGNAQNAAKLAQTSSENVGSGNNEMRQLLLAMSGITDSSNKISHIIKTIDDISFQTNILALNAAVEAARAGQHGKGFAVVAEEVRNLANRSSMAAKETSDLIQESLDRVKEGTERAEETANILERVVGNVSDVSALIEQIHSASKRQSDAIDGIGTVLGQINNVVRNESATTAKSADAADALTQQAHKLQEMIEFFKTARA